jgi:putative addiction module component (TIGR02574 family)
MMRPTEIPGVSELSIPEKILLVEDLWDDIVAADAKIAVPTSHKKELDRRLAKHQKNPGRLLSLQELQAHVEARK